MKKTNFAFFLIMAGLITVASGCVTRTINIESTPSNASVYLDDKYIGESPVSVPFTHYGTRKITVEKKDEDGRLVLKRAINFEKIKPPLYEVFPFDFISEILYPGKLEDKHDFHYQLDELDLPSIAERKKQILLNAEDLRRKALELD